MIPGHKHLSDGCCCGGPTASARVNSRKARWPAAHPTSRAERDTPSRRARSHLGKVR
jgi:hypothetical protein